MPCRERAVKSTDRFICSSCDISKVVSRSIGSTIRDRLTVTLPAGFDTVWIAISGSRNWTANFLEKMRGKDKIW